MRAAGGSSGRPLGGVAGMSMEIARVLVLVFLVLAVIAFLL